MPEPVGVIIPVVTIFDDQGELDLAGTASNIEWLIAAGVDALLVCGSCGEFSALEEGERCRVVEAAGCPSSQGSCTPRRRSRGGWRATPSGPAPTR